ncbi:hypothetical protein [Nonomuraea typhae]|uniref:hypothetical protein n=1 Tax=Nonomuraea typhae TaxID=2603600 RepID=UPI0012FC8F8C|nr:hypothetical protein [Nonomuraea typhae]
MTATVSGPARSLERYYRMLLRAYPPSYRRAHGDELLDVLLATTEADRAVPSAREAAGLLIGGARARVIALTHGNVARDGLHLGLAAVAVGNLATILPFAAEIPFWITLSALSVLAILRAWVWPAIPLTAAVSMKTVAIAGGWQFAEPTLLPLTPGVLTDRALFADSSPVAVAAAYGLMIVGLLVLGTGRATLRRRSWWWWAALPVAAWAGPAWMPDDSQPVISFSRMVLEFGLFAGAVVAGYLTRDLRWALGCALYLGVVSVTFGVLTLPEDGLSLTSQHLAYWALLALLTAAAAFIPFRQRKHVLD